MHTRSGSLFESKNASWEKNESKPFHSPVPVFGKVALPPFPYWTAAAPGLYSGTEIARSPWAQFAKLDGKVKQKFDQVKMIVLKENIFGWFIPAVQSCLFHFLFVAPFLHIDAGFHHHVLQLSCMQQSDMVMCHQRDSMIDK